LFRFNATAFNRPTLAEILASMQFNGVGLADINASYITNTSGQFDGVAGANITVSRQTLAGMIANGIAGAVFPIGKSRVFTSQWQGIGRFDLNNESFQIFIMEYNGTFAPNDRITINTERFTVTKNGQNALEDFDGNFVNLKAGINEVAFEDSAGSRTVLLRIEHIDRFL
jgi:hypothetical protein